MEKAVTALFNQLLLLFSIMQGINAEPLTGRREDSGKGKGCQLWRFFALRQETEVEDRRC